MNETANLIRSEPNLYQFNACVGNNGWRGMFSYIDGYQSATLVMLESILSKYIPNSDTPMPESAFSWNIDTAVYPILFSARHFIEIYIKQKIHIINQLKVKEAGIDRKLVTTHNINRLWDIFIQIVQDTSDTRIYPYVDKISPYIQDFEIIDPTGETFRYAYNKENMKHLENVGVIGLLHFYQKFQELSEVCRAFSFQIDDLVDEYKTNTFTKNLSRKDIEYISKELPIFDLWDQPILLEKKKFLKEKFTIGSKEFGEAINIIKNHIEFKRYIYPKIYELQIDKNNLSIILSEAENTNIAENLREDELASLRALVELGTFVINGQYFSEDYQGLFDMFLQEIKLCKYEKNFNYEYSMRHIKELKLGLKKLNYNDIIS